MTAAAGSVEAHYAKGDIMARAGAAIRAAGLDPDSLDVADLASMDNLHARGIVSTQEHAERLGVTAGMHVLDAGAGVGGPARYLVANYGCTVTGVDLTQEFVDVARELTRRCGMDSNPRFEHGDILALSFEDETFDAAWSLCVTMNIANKPELCAEIARVLKPGGRYGIAGSAAAPAGPPDFPQPWANDPANSFLGSVEDMVSALEAAGFRIAENLDETQAFLEFSRAAQARNKEAPPSPLSVTAISGDEFRERARNMVKSAADGRLINFFIIAEKL